MPVFASAPERRGLYPEIEPFSSGWMATEGVHEIYFEESGARNGRPAVILHGGPGGATNPTMRRFFDPERWRSVLFDQRGCGRSRPHASLEENTTWRLIEDIERLREKLGIERWTVFGGSWGSTLALAYAITHPNRVDALVLRGIFLLTAKEIRWFYQEGASMIFPDAWDSFLEPIPEAERHDLLAAYHHRLTHPDREVRVAAARTWSQWEGDTISVRGPEGRPPKFDEPDFAVAFARIECWYFVNGGFMPEDGWLLNNVHRVRRIPAWIVQGRFDVVTPMDAAWRLKKAWPEARFDLIADAGHASTEPGIVDGLIRACDAAYAVAR
jgi:proline iminopeptidase